jgi:hypothetical protein
MSKKFLVIVGVLALSMLLAGCGTIIQPALSHTPEEPQALGIQEGQLPPPGACRIWNPGEPAGQQPPPGRCSRLADEVPPGAWLLKRPNQKYVKVYVYDETRKGEVYVIRKFEAETGNFIDARWPR